VNPAKHKMDFGKGTTTVSRCNWDETRSALGGKTVEGSEKYSNLEVSLLGKRTNLFKRSGRRGNFCRVTKQQIMEGTGRVDFHVPGFRNSWGGELDVRNL